MSKEIDAFLNGGSGKAASFDNIGDVCEGTITNVQLGQQTSLEDNTPLTWSDGSPRMQLVISMQTDQKVDDNDDGIRRVYAKGGKFEAQTGSGKAMKDAIADAVKASGAKTIEEGGFLRVGYTGEGKRTNRGYSAPKLYKASYKAPVSSVAASDLFDE